MKLRCKLYLSEKGMGTVEIVIIVAVLVGVALIFREAILNFVTEMIDSIFNDSEIIDKIKVG